MAKPAPETYPEYFHHYVDLVIENDLSDAFANQRQVIEDFLPTIPVEKSDFSYAPGKWTLKEMLQHIIDAERIFCYRALAIARKESVSLPAFDEDTYALNSKASRREWAGLCEELKSVRRSSVLLFESFDLEMLNQSGVANNKSITVLALGFILIGHLYHHKGIIEERYIPDTQIL